MNTTPAPTSPLDRLFTALHASPVTRSSNRVIGGVCAGLAERTGMPVAFVRLLTVVLAVFGPAVLLYLLAWLLLPAHDGRVRLEQALRGGDPASIALLVVTALVLLPDAVFHRQWGWLALVGLGVVAFLIWRGSRRGGWSCGTHGTTGGHGSTAWGQDFPTGSSASQVPPGYRDEGGRPQDAPRS